VSEFSRKKFGFCPKDIAKQKNRPWGDFFGWLS
jgi:hypothetical protein